MYQFNVKYDGSKYDIQTFLKNHPGGINYIEPYENKEISKRMQNTEHSKAAYYLLREYQQGGRDCRDKTEYDKDLEVNERHNFKIILLCVFSLIYLMESFIIDIS